MGLCNTFLEAEACDILYPFFYNLIQNCFRDLASRCQWQVRVSTSYAEKNSLFQRAAQDRGWNCN